MIRILTAGTLALALSACGGDANPANASEATETATTTEPANAAPVEPAPSPAPAQDAQPRAATLPGVPDAEMPGKELPAEQFKGRWRVEGVAADANAPAGSTPDRSWVGRTLVFDDDKVAWLGANGAVETATQCENPTMSILWTAAIARNLAKPFRPAWSALNIPLDQVGPAHHWECDTAEPTAFGPDGIFYPIGKDQLVLNWTGNLILLLRKAG